MSGLHPPQVRGQRPPACGACNILAMTRPGPQEDYAFCASLGRSLPRSCMTQSWTLPLHSWALTMLQRFYSNKPGYCAGRARVGDQHQVASIK